MRKIYKNMQLNLSDCVKPEKKFFVVTSEIIYRINVDYQIDIYV
jgi:hypothetical protein